MESNNKEQLIEIICNDEKLATIKELEINYENGYTVIITKEETDVAICQDDFYITEATLEKVITDLCFNGGLTIYGTTYKFTEFIY